VNGEKRLDGVKLKGLYESGKSMKEMADMFGCSLHKVAYWMEKFKISRRARSEATYVKRNPAGDPFRFSRPTSVVGAELLGLGLGLYWGEGTKANKNSVRLGNTDPALVRIFIKFLRDICGIDEKKLRFGLQIFSDMNPAEALNFWVRELRSDKSRFQKPIITPSRGKGTYRRKTKYGVLTVYFNNKKLREVIVKELNRYGYGGD
jgi:hypothetical protein